jgi:hypothetical protein
MALLFGPQDFDHAAYPTRAARVRDERAARHDRSIGPNGGSRNTRSAVSRQLAVEMVGRRRYCPPRHPTHNVPVSRHVIHHKVLLCSPNHPPHGVMIRCSPCRPPT